MALTGKASRAISVLEMFAADALDDAAAAAACCGSAIVAPSSMRFALLYSGVGITLALLLATFLGALPGTPASHTRRLSITSCNNQVEISIGCSTQNML